MQGANRAKSTKVERKIFPFACGVEAHAENHGGWRCFILLRHVAIDEKRIRAIEIARVREPLPRTGVSTGRVLRQGIGE